MNRSAGLSEAKVAEGLIWVSNGISAADSSGVLNDRSNSHFMELCMHRSQAPRKVSMHLLFLALQYVHARGALFRSASGTRRFRRRRTEAGESIAS